MNQDAVNYCNEVIRPLADVLAGLMDHPAAVLGAFKAKGHAEKFGFDQALVEKLEELKPQDYGFEEQPIPTGNDGRTATTNRELLALLRVVGFLGRALDMDPAAKLLIRKWAVNPVSIRSAVG